MSSHQPFNTVPPIGEVSLALNVLNYETKCQHWLFSSNRRDSSFFYWIFERDFTSLLGLLFSLSFLFGFLLPCYIFLFRLVFPFCFSFSLDFYSIVVTFWISSNFFFVNIKNNIPLFKAQAITMSSHQPFNTAHAAHPIGEVSFALN